jgi:hypothetical protein
MENINFYQGLTNLFDKKEDKQIEKIKEHIEEFFNMKNIHFLLGSGTSCNAIPNMKGLYDAARKKIYSQNDKQLKTELYSIIKRLQTKNNLEDILGILYSHRVYLHDNKDRISELTTCDKLIKTIETSIFEKINVD